MHVHEKDTCATSHRHHQRNPPDSSKTYCFTLTYDKTYNKYAYTHTETYIQQLFTQVTDTYYILSAHTYNSHFTCIIFLFYHTYTHRHIIISDIFHCISYNAGKLRTINNISHFSRYFMRFITKISKYTIINVTSAVLS